MVVFTCNHCGESLQKPRVEKHYTIQCRRPKSLTCVDCLKDFRNEEYSVHIKCITEEERYSAKGSLPGVVKKGELKQESWTDMIKMIVQSEANLEPSLKNLFNVISTYTNVPRKKVKFINFVKSSSGGRVNFKDIEAAWDLIEKYKNQNKKADENGVNKNCGDKHKLSDGYEDAPATKKNKLENQGNDRNGSENGKEHKLKKKTLQTMPCPNGNEEKVKELNQKEGQDKFSFKNTILNVLSAKNNITLKKLQKKVLSVYLKETGNTEYSEKTIKKFNKKLGKLPNVKITDDVVSLTVE